jgi:predicted Zn-dependent protease
MARDYLGTTRARAVGAHASQGVELQAMRTLLVFCLWVAAAACVGCSRAALRSPASARAAPSAQPAPAADRGEIALGRRLERQIVGFDGLDHDPRLARYVSSIGLRLAAHSARPELPWTFRVLDDSAVEAFATPGGFIYVTRGTFAWLGSEAELAGLLAHEISHVVARHTERSRAWIAARSGWFSHSDDLSYYELSRDEERDADAMAVRLLQRTGYDSRAVAAMLTDLRSAELASHSSDADDDPRTDDHPPTAARIARAALLAAGRPKGTWRRRAYLFHIDGLAFGSDPRRGRLVGRSYACAEGGFEFELPRGWKAWTSDGWLFASGHDKTILLLVPTAFANARSARALIDSDAKGTLEPATMAGFSALRGTLRLHGAPMQVVILRAARRSYLFFLLGGPSEQRALRTITRSFRRSTEPLAEPLRIAIERVTRPTTLRAFAREHDAAVSASQLGWLNGLGVGARLGAGALVKNIVARAAGDQPPGAMINQ